MLLYFLLCTTTFAEDPSGQEQRYAAPTPIRIYLDVEPADSEIMIDGHPTTERFVFLHEGTHQITAQKDGFSTFKQSVSVQLGVVSEIAIHLQPLDFQVHVAVQNAKSITAQHENGSIWNISNNSTISLPWGMYDFEAHRKKKSPWKKNQKQLPQQAHEPKAVTWKQQISAATRIRRCFDTADQYLRCVWHLACGKAPKAVAFSPDGKELWVALLMGPIAVEVYDTKTWEKTHAINLNQSGAVEFVFSPNQNKVYASQMQNSSVYEIDSKSKKVLRKIRTKGSWTKVLAINNTGTRLYASNWVSNDVSEIDLDTWTVRNKWKTGKVPRGLYLSEDQKYLYVATYESGTLERIDLSNGHHTVLFSKGRAMRHIVADEKKGLLYISDMQRDVIWKYDIASGTTTILSKTESHPNTLRLSPDKRLLFVSTRGRNNPKSYILAGPEYGVVQVFDTKTGDLVDVAIGRNQPTGLDLSTNGLLASSDFLDANINIYQVPPTKIFLESPSPRTEDYQTYMPK